MQLFSAFLVMATFLFNYYSCAHNVMESATTVELQWYMHDTPFNGPTPSSIPVTAYNATDFQNEAEHFLFGQIFVFDDPLTLNSSTTSASFGRAQGTYTYVSRETFAAYVSYTVNIQSGEYNGSTLNIQGASAMGSIEKYAIVGGTGRFLLARGILEEKVVNLFGPFNASATLSHRATVY